MTEPGAPTTYAAVASGRRVQMNCLPYQWLRGEKPGSD